MSAPLAHDLTPVIMRYLDRHLAVQLLNAISEMEPCPYNEDALNKALYKVCSGTKLMGDLCDLVEALYEGKEAEDKLAHLQKMQQELMENHNNATKAGGIGIYTQVVDTAEGQEKLKAMIKEQTLLLEGMKNFGLKPADLTEIMAFARTIFEYGQYSDSGRMLRFLRQIDPTTYKLNNTRMWGQLACGILTCLRKDKGHSWKDTVDDLVAVNESIDVASCDLNTVLFFLHWSLFVFLASGTPSGRDQLLDVFMSDKYFPVICTAAPHLLRYICVAMLTVRGQRRGGRMSPSLKALRDFMENDTIKHNDPITDVVRELFVNSNARGALAKIKACESVMANDYFLCSYTSEFVESIRRNCFEDICRVHSTVDLKEVAAMLGVNAAEAEKWLVNVVRPARINARVDGESQVLHVQADNTTPSASHLVMEKTKLLSFRVQSLYKTCMDARSAAAAPAQQVVAVE